MMALRQHILATLAYHDVLDMPLTAWEVFLYELDVKDDTLRARREVYQKEDFSICPPTGGLHSKNSIGYAGVLQTLKQLKTESVINEKNGFYFLNGRDGLYEVRIERMKIAEEKWHRVSRVLRWYRAMPFVRAVFLSGSVALGNAKETSDVDVLVVTKAGRIWTARFFLLVLTLLCGKLRSARLSKKTSGKICLNHFITTKSLAMHARGLYNAATYVRLVPLFGSELLEKFYDANTWIFSYFPNALRFAIHRKTFGEQPRPKKLQKSFECVLSGRVGNVFETIIGAAQGMFIRRNALSNSKNGRIVASRGELAFHPESPEQVVINKFRERVKKLH